MSLINSIETGSIPLTDVANTPIPAQLIEKFDLKRFSQLQASSLAIHSLRISLPPFNRLSDLEILEAREKLIEQLIPLRYAMLELSPTLRDGIENELDLLTIDKEAQYISETKIFPAISELKKKLEMEKGRFWRRVVLKGITILPAFLINWTTKNALTAAIGAVNSSKSIALDLIKREENIERLKERACVGCLLDIVTHPIFQKNKIKGLTA